MPLSDYPWEKKPYYLPILFIISATSHFPFVLNGFGEIDATKIAVSVIDILKNGPGSAFSNYYFSDVIPLYISYLKVVVKMLNYNYSYLPVVMNYTNAVVGTLIVIPAFFLTRQLFRSPSVAFFSVLALIFAPSFYQSTIMGFPHLIAFFFLLLSLWLFLAAIDQGGGKTAPVLMVASCLFLTVAFLFKSDFVLGSGAFFGFLLMRKAKDARKIAGAILIILVAGTLFLIFRNMTIGSGGGTTMSKSALSEWYTYSLIIPNNVTYFLRQTKPIAYGAGLCTFFLGIVAFLYYLFKRRFDILAFILVWAAVPTIFWIVMIGNNARHNMFTTLPILVLIMVFIHEKTPKYIAPLAVLLICGNFFAVSPSSSILTPSGNLWKSNRLLKERMIKFHTSAKQIANIEEDKIAVLGYFHNPHVVFEIIQSEASYEAQKIGREDYKILTGGKEYIFIYFVATKPEHIDEGIDRILLLYNLHDYVFVSAMYDLQSLEMKGLKTKKVDIIERSAL